MIDLVFVYNSLWSNSKSTLIFAGEVDAEFKQLLTSDKIREIVNAVPDDWLNWTDGQETPQDLRDIYIQFLEERIKHSELFVNEAQHARKALI